MNSRHSIVDKVENLEIPLELDGTISYFSNLIPKKKDIEDCCHVELTSPEQWDPHADAFERRGKEVHGQGDRGLQW